MATDTGVKGIKPISCSAPALNGRLKASVHLGRGDILDVGIQVVAPKGGETNMHAHTGIDSTWLVLKGRAKFYGFGDVLIGEAGPNEGFFIEKAVPYWFEASGDEPLEILHIKGRDKAVKNDRVDYAPPRERQKAVADRGRQPTAEELEKAAMA